MTLFTGLNSYLVDILNGFFQPKMRRWSRLLLSIALSGGMLGMLFLLSPQLIRGESSPNGNVALLSNSRPSRQLGPVLTTSIEVTSTARIDAEIVYTFTVSHDPTLSNFDSVTMTGLIDRLPSPDENLPVVPIEGDVNNNQKLDAGEFWIYTHSYKIKAPPLNCNPLAPWANIYGKDDMGNTLVFTSSKPSVSFQPKLKIDTYVTGARNNNTTVWVGDTLRHTYNLSLDDGANSDTSPPGDVEIVNYSNDIRNHVQSQISYPYSVVKTVGDSDDLLEPLEIWVYTTQYVVGVSESMSVTNNFTVTGRDNRDGKSLCAEYRNHSYAVENRSFLEVDKTGPGKAAIGETAIYQYTVRYDTLKSDGSPLKNIILYDDKIGPITNLINKVPGNPGTTRDDDVLEPGESWVYEGQYTIKQSDPKFLTNTVVVSGTQNSGKVVTDIAKHVIAVGFNPYRPKLEITKTGLPSADYGSIVTYSLVVNHAPFSADSDQSDVSNPIVTDNVAQVLPGYNGDTNGDGKLNSGETWVYTATYHVTAIKESSPVQSKAVVVGQDKDGDDITANTLHVLSVIYKPVLTMTSYSAPASTQVGRVITSYYKVKHYVGESDNSAISITDIIALSDTTGSVGRLSSGDDGDKKLEEGEIWVFAITYTVKATDTTPLNITGTLRYRQISSEKIVNSSHQVIVAYGSYLELVKEGPKRANVGDRVVYTFTLRHSSISDGSPVSTVVITDHFTSPDLVSGQAVPEPIVLVSRKGNNDTLLEGGEIWIYTTSLIVTKSHSGLLTDKVEASGKDVIGRDVNNAASLSTQVGGDGSYRPLPDIALMGTSNVVLNGVGVFTFTVKHNQASDKTPMKDIRIFDTLGTQAKLVTITNNSGDTELDSGETWIYTSTYTIAKDNFDGYVDNIATVWGTDYEGDKVDFFSSVFPVKIRYQPVLTVSIDKVTTPIVGNELVYTLKIKHAPTSDGSPIDGIIVADNLHLDPIACTDDDNDDGKLNQGEDWDCKVKYNVASTDIEPLPLIATVKGEGINQSSTTAMTMATFSEIDYNPKMKVRVIAPGIIRNSDFVVYTLTVSHDNSEDTSPISSLILTDTLTIDDKIPDHIVIHSVGGDINQNQRLDGAEQWVYTATYRVDFKRPVPYWMELGVTVDGVDLDGTILQVTGNAQTKINPHRPLLTLAVEHPLTVTINSTPVLTLMVSLTKGSSDSKVEVMFDGLPLPWYFVKSVLNPNSKLNNTNPLLVLTETQIYTTLYPIELKDTNGVTLTVIATGRDEAGFELLEEAKFTYTQVISVEHTPWLAIDRVSPPTAKIGDRITSTFTIYHDTRPSRKSDKSSAKVAEVIDDVAGPATFMEGDINGNKLLDEDENWTYQATYIIPSVTGAEFRSKSTVIWEDKDGDANSYTTSDPVIQLTGLSLIQIAPPKTKIGDNVPYEFRLTYIGESNDDLPIKNVTSVQNSLVGSCLPSGGDGDTLLEVKEVWSCKVFFTVPETITQLTVNKVFSNISTITVQSNKDEILTATDTGKTTLCYDGCSLVDLFSIYGDDQVEVGDAIFYSYFVRGFKDKADVIISLGITSSLSKLQPRYIGGDDDNDKRLEAGETWVYFSLYPITSTEPMTVINTAVLTAIVEGINVEKTALVSYTTRITGTLPKPLTMVYLPTLLKQPPPRVTVTPPTPTNTPVPKTVLKVVSQRSQPIIATRGQPVVFIIKVGHNIGSNTPPDSFSVKSDLLAGGSLIIIPAAVATQTNRGDIDGNDELDVGEIWEYQFTHDTTCDTPSPLASNIWVDWKLNGVPDKTPNAHTLEVQVRSEYFEGFDNSASGWPIFSDPNEGLYQYDLSLGKYVMTSYKNSGSSVRVAYPHSRFSNYTVRLECEWSTNSGEFCGIIFGVKRPNTSDPRIVILDSGYRFIADIRTNPMSFKVQQATATSWPDVPVWNFESSYPLNTQTKPVKLELSCKGDNTVIVKANDIKVAEGKAACNDGEVGIIMSGLNSTINADNFQVCGQKTSSRLHMTQVEPFNPQ